MSFMICRIKKRLKKMEDIMEKLCLSIKTVVNTNKEYCSRKRKLCQNTLELTASAARPIKY